MKTCLRAGPAGSADDRGQHGHQQRRTRCNSTDAAGEQLFVAQAEETSPTASMPAVITAFAAETARASLVLGVPLNRPRAMEPAVLASSPV